MNDLETRVADLRRLVDDFVTERDWHQFHTPKNLSLSLAIEAGELMEHFQWLTPEASRDVAADAARWADISDELDDVLCYALAITNELSIDLSQAIKANIAKNRLKYPADTFRGRYGA